MGIDALRRVWHIDLYRDEGTLQPVECYNKMPIEPTVAMGLVLDPMLATGGSASAAIEFIKKEGGKFLTFVCLVASPEGVKLLEVNHPDVPVSFLFY